MSNNLFTTDDYSIIDLSGRTLKNQWFPFPGSYVQYLAESTGSIFVAFGSGGAGPPKQIRMNPGDRVTLKDKPFSGLYITCENPTSAKILVSSSGIEVDPNPASITSIGEIETVKNPVKVDGPLGSGKMGFSVSARTLTTDAGDPKPGRYIHKNVSRSPYDGTNWSNLPGNGTQITEATINAMGLPRIEIPYSDTADPPAAHRIGPIEKGDIVYIASLAIVISEWTRAKYEGGGYEGDGTTSFDFVGFAPLGAYCTVGGAVMGIHTRPAYEISGLLTPGTQADVDTPARMYAVPDSEADHRNMSARRRPYLFVTFTDRSFIVTDTADTLNLYFPVPHYDILKQGMQTNPAANLYYRTDGDRAHEYVLMKPAVDITLDCVLLKKGVDF